MPNTPVPAAIDILARPGEAMPVSGPMAVTRLAIDLLEVIERDPSQAAAVVVYLQRLGAEEQQLLGMLLIDMSLTSQELVTRLIQEHYATLQPIAAAANTRIIAERAQLAGESPFHDLVQVVSEDVRAGRPPRSH